MGWPRRGRGGSCGPKEGTGVSQRVTKSQDRKLRHGVKKTKGGSFKTGDQPVTSAEPGDIKRMKW